MVVWWWRWWRNYYGGDEISKLLNDRGKESEPKEPRKRRRKKGRGGEGREMYRKEGNGWLGEGRGFDNCNSLPCQGVSSAAVVVVDE